MKILLVSSSHDGGGAESVFMRESLMLHQRGHQVAHLTAASPPCSEDYEHFTYDAGLKAMPGKNLFARFIHRLHPLYNRSFIRKYRLYQAFTHAIKIFKPDIVHFQHFYSEYMIAPSLLTLPKKYDIPTVFSFHGPEAVCPSGTLLKGGWKTPLENCDAICSLKEDMGKSCIRHSCLPSRLFSEVRVRNFRLLYQVLPEAVDVITTPSRKLLSLVEASKAFHPSSLQLLYNPLPSELMEIPKEALSERKKNYFLMAGRLEKIKGIWPLIEAFEQMPDIPLKIVGTGSIYAEIEAYIRDKNLIHIELLGRQSGASLWQAYRDAYAVIIPSIWFETASVVVQEAAAHTVPVIASDIGGLGQFVRDGETGCLFPPGDVEALREKVHYLWKSPEVVASLGQAAYEQMHQTFRMDDVYEQYIRLFNMAKERHENGKRGSR